MGLKSHIIFLVIIMMFDRLTMEMIIGGRKTVTRRVVKSNKRPAIPNNIHTLKIDRTKAVYGYIYIWSVKKEKWSMINEYEAKREGFDNLEQYKQYFYKVNGYIGDNDFVWVINFEYMKELDLDKMTDEDLFYYCYEWSDNDKIVNKMYKKLLRMRRK